MYKFRSDVNVVWKSKTEASKVIGLSKQHLINITNGKIACSKVTAYCIAKYIDNEKEILDFFERVE